MSGEDGRARRARRLAWALAAVFGAAAIRFAPFLAGGTLYRRDAGFFFIPWRIVFARLASSGVFPAWNDWMSTGRPFAADPNAAVFWPLAPLLLVVSPTALAFITVFLVLAVFFLSLYRLGLGPEASAAGTLVLLFSGVFQTLPVYLTTCAAVLPLAFALAEAPRLGSPDPASRGRARAFAALAFGLSALGGEPSVTLIGAAAFVAVAAFGAPARGRAIAGALLALALGAGLAAVQICPATLELARSARGAGLRPEHGALFRSVRPSRVLTLLEPRLTGDPQGDAASDWGSRTFDAGSPYFEDLALGLIPLLFAAAAWGDGRGRAALLLAVGAAGLSFGRFLPGASFFASAVSVFRYPEKWWLLVTFALAAAAAVGVDAVFMGDAEARVKARRILLKTAMAMALLCGALLALALGAEDLLRRGIWAVGLGTGDASGAVVAGVLRAPLLMATATLLVCAVVLRLSLFTIEEKRQSPVLLAGVLALLFLADAARRVAGTCPSGPPDLYTRETPAVALVLREAGVAVGGRFYDDGADDPATVARRTRDAGGLDPLQPAVGAAFGIRYAGENDIDRMTAAPSVLFARSLAGLRWGEDKVARLRTLGVAVVRTAAPPPDPLGVVEIGRFGEDRILRLEGTRAEFAVLPGGAGSVAVEERRAGGARLRVRVGLPAAVLSVARSFDPNWHARLDGAEVVVRPGDGYLMTLDVPAGEHAVTLAYENPTFPAGGAVSVASLLAIALLARRRALP